MGRYLFLVVALAAAIVFVSDTAKAERRVALVIGNAAYAHVAHLDNPPNDAAAIAETLGKLGFEVSRADDLGISAFLAALRDFGSAAARADVAVLFYAGHGVEIDKQNYLVPVDARLAADRDVDFEAVPLDLALRSVEGASRFRLVILDACRDNPFVVAMRKSNGTRSIGRGLARVEPAASDMLVAYAASEGTTAADGEAAHSPYTAALLKFLPEPGLEVGLMFRKVRDDVMKATGDAQRPFVYGSLSSAGFYFMQEPAAAAPVAAPPASAEAPKPWIGMKVKAVPKEMATSPGLEDAKGAIVVEVIEGGPSKAAGIEAQDVIRTLDGTAVADARDFVARIAQTAPGAKVVIGVLRGGTEATVEVTVGVKVPKPE